MEGRNAMYQKRACTDRLGLSTNRNFPETSPASHY